MKGQEVKGEGGEGQDEEVGSTDLNNSDDKVNGKERGREQYIDR